jgi:hypothetical protein
LPFHPVESISGSKALFTILVVSLKSAGPTLKVGLDGFHSKYVVPLLFHFNAPDDTTKIVEVFPVSWKSI